MPKKRGSGGPSQGSVGSQSFRVNAISNKNGEAALLPRFTIIRIVYGKRNVKITSRRRWLLLAGG